MLGKLIVDRLAAEGKVKVKQKLCLNRRSGGEKCNLCKDYCPSGAALRDSATIIDADYCEGCGICTAVCPTQALDLSSNNYLEMLLQAKGKDSCLLACRKKGGEAGEVRANLVTSCLGSLHWEFIAALLLVNKNGKTTFYLAPCSECSRSRGVVAFYNSHKKAVKLLEGFGLTPRVEFILDKKQMKEPKGSISRREVFSIFKKSAVGTFNNVLDGFLKTEDSSAVTRQRECLQLAIESKTITFYLPEGDLPFTNWVINERCSACGLCAGICPWDAWEIKEINFQRNMCHNPWKCVSCGLCASQCPQGAKEKTPWEGMPLKTEALLKKTLELVACRRCSTKIIPSAGVNLCASCEKKDGLKKSLKKSFGTTSA